MSAKAGSAGAIAVGALVIVAGIVQIATGVGALTGTMTILAGVSLLAGGAMGLMFQPEAANQQQVKARDLEVATAGTAFPVPVIFGKVKVTPNFINYNRDHFSSEKVLGEKPTGGKGGGSDSADAPVVG